MRLQNHKSEVPIATEQLARLPIITIINHADFTVFSGAAGGRTGPGAAGASRLQSRLGRERLACRKRGRKGRGGGVQDRARNRSSEYEESVEQQHQRNGKLRLLLQDGSLLDDGPDDESDSWKSGDDEQRVLLVASHGFCLKQTTPVGFLHYAGEYNFR